MSKKYITLGDNLLSNPKVIEGYQEAFLNYTAEYLGFALLKKVRKVNEEKSEILVELVDECLDFQEQTKQRCEHAHNLWDRIWDNCSEFSNLILEDKQKLVSLIAVNLRILLFKEKFSELPQGSSPELTSSISIMKFILMENNYLKTLHPNIDLINLLLDTLNLNITHLLR